MPYVCGYRAKTAQPGIAGLSAVLLTADAAPAGLPGGAVYSALALQLELSPPGGDSPEDPELRAEVEAGEAPICRFLRFGYGYFNGLEARSPKPQRAAFLELRSGPDPVRDRRLLLLADPGPGYHAYALQLDFATGSAACFLDGLKLLSLQGLGGSEGRGGAQGSGQTAVRPSFLALATVLEAGLLGAALPEPPPSPPSGPLPCNVQSCAVLLDGCLVPADLKADYRQVVQVGQAALPYADEGILDACNLWGSLPPAPPSPP